jgi:hypothetical protein
VLNERHTPEPEVISRGGPLITVIACRVTSAADARSTCRSVLATLRWRSPRPR